MSQANFSIQRLILPQFQKTIACIRHRNKVVGAISRFSNIYSSTITYRSDRSKKML